jgi:hypothetical protein
MVYTHFTAFLRTYKRFNKGTMRNVGLNLAKAKEPQGIVAVEFSNYTLRHYNCEFNTLK